MSDKWRVVVREGSANLYEISKYKGTYYVYRIRVGFLTNSSESIGTTTRLEDGISLICSHAGSGIKSIEEIS